MQRKFRPGAMLALALMMSLTACASGEQRLAPISDSAPGTYRLGAGDEIHVVVFGLDSATRTYVVGDAGTISMPLVGTLSVERKTVPEVEALLVAALRDKQLIRDPSVSVEVGKYRPFFILGEVQKPGSYPYVPGMSVLTAVSIAGGYTFRANTKGATVVRNRDGKVTRGSAKPETVVLPGDTIKIAEAWF